MSDHDSENDFTDNEGDGDKKSNYSASQKEDKISNMVSAYEGDISEPNLGAQMDES